MAPQSKPTSPKSSKHDRIFGRNPKWKSQSEKESGGQTRVIHKAPQNRKIVKKPDWEFERTPKMKIGRKCKSQVVCKKRHACHGGFPLFQTTSEPKMRPAPRALGQQGNWKYISRKTKRASHGSEAREAAPATPNKVPHTGDLAPKL